MSEVPSILSDSSALATSTPANGADDLSAFVELTELQAERDALLKIKDTIQSNGINFYRPHAKQHRFHLCNATGRYVRTGNRFGKSELGIAEDIAMCRGGREWYRYAFDILNGAGQVVDHHPGGFNHPLVTSGIPRRPVKGLILVVDWEMAHKVFTNREGAYETWGKLFKLLPKDAIHSVKLSRGGHVHEIFIKRPKEFGGGVSSLTIDTIESWKHNKLAGESADWDFIHIDEPCPEDMFNSYARGLADRNGRYWFTCTPLDQMWINDTFCPPGMRLVEHTPDSGIEYKVDGTSSRRFIITGSSYDNPHKNIAGLEEMASRLSSAERAARIDGLPKAFAGVIYREFIYDLHVLCDLPAGWHAYDNPPKDYTIRVAWDVHDAKPQAILVVATSPQGIAFVCKEWFFDRLIQPNVIELKSWLEGRNVVDLLIDPKAVNPDPRDESTILDDLWAADLPFDKASKDLTLGISRVREKLNERRVTQSQLPTICFSPDLTETLWEFTHYLYDSKTNKPKDEHDHMMENLYRLVLNGLDYVEPAKENEYVTAPLRIRSNEIDFSRDSAKPRSLLRL